MTGITISKSVLESYIVSSNDALELKLVRRATDVDDDSTTFRPEMTHQVFGERFVNFVVTLVSPTQTFGLIRTSLYNTIDSLRVCLERVLKPDNVINMMAGKLQAGFHTNLDNFCLDLNKDINFRPPGELQHRFTTECNENTITKQYEVYLCTGTTPEFRRYHERLQTFLLWFIDAASFIDIDDNNWRFFVMYEKYTQDGSTMYAVVGYMTVYQYYAYPKNIRPRISQMLVLPPYQRRGLGEKLLSTMYQHYINDKRVIDITVEDSSEQFQRVRDYLDAKNCLTLSSFQPALLHQGFTQSMAQEACSTLKLNKKQCRRVYEILRLRATEMSDEVAYRSYRLAVKQRLNVPYQKEQRDLEKLKRALKDKELLSLNSPQQRLECLEQDYKELEEQYQAVVRRLAFL
uniref:Histone acetyltransferase type B catalytic subunit n=1 Tax=Timema tahoe TaxID=61484 RepID=A0A7R9FIM4_9NEOP|nr:unnamed protein product [Timema tahoe]